MTAIPFIDIFAGPGGLSEGFSRYGRFSNSPTTFESRLAIEKDRVAAETLRLRSFYRAFPEEDVPEAYYDIVRGQMPVSSVQHLPEWRAAEDHVWNVELGVEPEVNLHKRIARALNGERNWVLLGGPPCQAYSVVGRSRMTGVGEAGRQPGADLTTLRLSKESKFVADRRHTLYREYLRIVAVHQPAVFIMENVKGILSARLRDTPDDEGEPAFTRIREDLERPWSALREDKELHLLQQFRDGPEHEYTLYSLTVGGERAGSQLEDREFAVKSEAYGIPQRRHRVIIIGLRNDIQARPTPLERKPLRQLRDAIGDLPAVRSEISKRSRVREEWQEAIRAKVRQLSLPTIQDQKVREVFLQFCSADSELHRGAEFIANQGEHPTGEFQRWIYDARLGGVTQHYARSHMLTDLVRYLYVAAAACAHGKSPSLEEWPADLLPDHRNVSVNLTTGRPQARGFSDRFKVQVWHEPASTVTSHIHKDGHYFIHPDPMQCRSLTVREAARLQTFPDNYFFCGNRTEQYKQVGNAVPPFLAYQIAAVVRDLLGTGSSSASASG